ncbi:MAG: AAA family ATPase [Prevotella sp.]|nr:AAA family ATPase [Prevotella sp.]
MATRKKMDLLTAVEQIVEKAKGSGLNSEFYRKADKYIKFVAEKLELTKEQSVMMALFIDNSDNSDITIRDFGKFLDCRTTRIIKYMNDIDVLEKREFVRCCHGRNHVSYRVPMEVIEAFKKNEKYTPRDVSGLSCHELFVEIENIFDMREDNELTYEATVEKIRRLFDCNADLLYVQKVRSHRFRVDDEMMLVLFSHLFVNNNDDDIRFRNLEFLYQSSLDRKLLKRDLDACSHILLIAKMIEYNNSDGFEDRESFRMTAEAKRELFAELNLSSLNRNKKCGDLVKSEDILPKKMFYGEKISAQIAELGQLLDENQYRQIRARMKETGFRCGFTCLFYGAPGTGKTETVLQLAKQTGRDILQVNISQIKSMWVGESEKNIKYVFDNYRAKVKENEMTPILLFNEADAVIGKRQEGAERAVDKMENSIQNIILQEMETLDGIMIATTNLAQNMDKAFERRFLYKIKFEKPTLEARMSIWHEMIPSLNEADVRVLASKYDFSGGQIENIARHYTIGQILHGDSANIVDELSGYCDSERLEGKGCRKIGF